MTAASAIAGLTEAGVQTTSAEDGLALTPRQIEIVKMIELQGFVTIEALARQFSVSSQTIRRDVIRLDEAQVLQRFHGGAGLPEDRVRLGHAQKQALHADAKTRIGRAVAGLVHDGAAVFLDVGTTVEAVARALSEKSQLHIFTNSLASAMIFAGSQRHHVFVVSGLLIGADGSLVGDSAVAAVARFKFDYAVIGCSGFDDDGAAMDFDMQKVAVKQAVLKNSRHAIVAVDASKFSRTAIVRVAPAEAFHKLVSDSTPPPRLNEALTSSGIDILIA